MKSKRGALRLVPALGVLGLVACASSYGRTALPASEAHYERSISHELPRAVAFARLDGALETSTGNLQKVLSSRQPETFSMLLEPTVAYRTGGPMGPTRHARYTLKVSVGERSIDFSFDLGPERETGHFAPEDAIPYIRNDFDQVVGAVERAVRTP